jgi:2-polyprenyl-3-methyl-5-hydroxy-6-metoxy-1,4-benzoquinol methylase
MKSDRKNAQAGGNYYNKYETNNGIEHKIMGYFWKNMRDLLNTIDFSSVYEAGCGEGYVSEYLSRVYQNKKWSASDISKEVVEQARIRVPHVRFSVKSIYETTEEDGTFDLVIASEVLEHLERPEDALKEIIRISKKYILLSVPYEPIWRMANILRLKYLKSFGNTPGHIQHWSGKGIQRMVTKYCKIKEVKTPFPWTMMLCEK